MINNSSIKFDCVSIFTLHGFCTILYFFFSYFIRRIQYSTANLNAIFIPFEEKLIQSLVLAFAFSTVDRHDVRPKINMDAQDQKSRQKRSSTSRVHATGMENGGVDCYKVSWLTRRNNGTKLEREKLASVGTNAAQPQESPG